MSKNCFICGSSKFKVVDTISFKSKDFDLEICEQCKVGLVFDSTMDYNDYGEYQEKSQEYYDNRL